MGKIEDLSVVYERHVGVPWQRTVAGAQRVMLVVYEKELERTLRDRIGEFEQATLRSGHDWTLVDCTRWFAEWMGNDEYRDAWFEDPNLLGMKLEGEFRKVVASRLRSELEAASDNGVVAVLGVASLYGFPACIRGDPLGRACHTRTPCGVLSRDEEREQLPAAGRPRRVELPGPGRYAA